MTAIATMIMSRGGFGGCPSPSLFRNAPHADNQYADKTGKGMFHG